MSILVCDGVSLSYGTDVILENISFSVNKGEKLGVIGVNGAGKSTLMKIAVGEIAPTSGDVFIPSDVSIGMLDQWKSGDFSSGTVFECAAEYFPDLVKREKELDGLLARLSSNPASATEYERLRHDFEIHGGNEYKTKIRSMLARFGFGAERLDENVSELSGGQKTKLALASLLASDKDIIILDEPTNHLDYPTVEWLENYIKGSPKTFIIISHDRYFLDRVTTDTLEIENRTAMKYSGSYTAFKKKKKQLLEIRQKHYELQQKEISRLEAFIENQRKWNRERNIIAAESRQKAIDRMEKIEKPKSAPKTVSISVHSTTGSHSVLSVRHLAKAYGNLKLFDDLSFDITKGERVLIIGANGCGKSTLLKIINGSVKADKGVCEPGYSQKIGYYDQEVQLLTDSNTVVDELIEADESLLPGQARKILASYGFYGDDAFKQVKVLSGGERARLSIAKLVLQKISFLVLDEPTNHLDIPSKEVFEEALLNFEGTILAVSHDRYFINTLATRIIEIDREGYDGGYTDFKGNYETFIRKCVKKGKERETVSVKESKSEFEAEKKAKGLRRSREKRLEFINAEIPRLEARQKELEKEAEEYAADYVKLSEIDEEQQKISEALDALYEEYMALEECGE